MARHLLRTARRFSAEARVEAPVKLFGIHARYASAAYVSAAKQGKTAAVESDFLALASVLAKDAAFAAHASRAEISPVGPDFATYVKRTTPLRE